MTTVVCACVAHCQVIAKGMFFSEQSSEARILFMYILWLWKGFWRSLLLVTSFIEVFLESEFLEGKLD